MNWMECLGLSASNLQSGGGFLLEKKTVSVLEEFKAIFHTENQVSSYNENSRALDLITIRGVEVAVNQGGATILREDIAITISDSGRSASLDRETGCQFLVDSGADVSILPWRKTKGEVATIQENNDLSTVNRASKYFNLLKLYPDITKPNLVNRVVKHGVKHHILTTGQPVYSKARQLAPDKLKLAKQEFQFMLDNDIIRPSKSQ
ncbi:transposon Ty3-I Gag-Pol polyprotein [Trichonephila clavipes]|nr:transposon Ty3-I Gag-Pol polyprotein [Trichonephila clavipes]